MVEGGLAEESRLADWSLLIARAWLGEVKKEGEGEVYRRRRVSPHVVVVAAVASLGRRRRRGRGRWRLREGKRCGRRMDEDGKRRAMRVPSPLLIRQFRDKYAIVM